MLRALTSLTLFSLSSLAWAAEPVVPSYKVLHAFTGGADGGGLWGSLTLDPKGNLFGSTSGTVFKLTPQTDAPWDLKVLHTFHYPGKFGADLACKLIFDNGDLYGTTMVGGGPHTSGTVFKLTPGPTGWKLSVIHRFKKGDPANGPYAGMVKDAAGNLFGVGGVAFELSPGSSGWSETILHHFPATPQDGWGTLAGVISDAAGNLYGTTEHGGGSNRCGGGCGIVYELQKQADGKWKETMLHRFQDESDGSLPGVGKLLLDDAGSLYGTAYGGTTGYGVIFKLTPDSNGKWHETVLYNFTGGLDGYHPAAGVVMDKAGNIFGTTIQGGDSHCDCGIIYKFTPQAGGPGTFTVLHRLIGTDGAEPDANLIMDDSGNLYGTTASGGAGGYGVVFEVTP